jgi:hypothetical protein
MVLIEFTKAVAGISSLKIALLTVVQEVLQDQLKHMASAMVECGCQLLFLIDPRMLSRPDTILVACAAISRAANMADLKLTFVAENIVTHKCIVFAVGRHRGVKGPWAVNEPGAASSSAVVEPPLLPWHLPRLVAKAFNNKFTAIWIGTVSQRSASAIRRRGVRRHERYHKARQGSSKDGKGSAKGGKNKGGRGKGGGAYTVVESRVRQTSKGGKQGKYG